MALKSSILSGLNEDTTSTSIYKTDEFDASILNPDVGYDDFSGFEKYLVNTLQFNDDVNEIETRSTINSYRNILSTISGIDESLIVMNESNQIFDTIRQLIDRFIQYIKDSIQALVSSADNSLDDKYTAAVKALKKDTSSVVVSSYVGYHYPDIKDIADDEISSIIESITGVVDDLCDGKDVNVSADFSKDKYKALAMNLKRHATRNEFTGEVEDYKTFKQYVYGNIVYTTKETKSYIQGLVSGNLGVKHNNLDSSKCAAKLIKVKNELATLKEKINRRRKEYKANDENKKDANILLNTIGNIITSYTWFINTLHWAAVKQATYTILLSNKTKNPDNEKDYIDARYKPVKESGTIHGEPFNSDTLFGNEDLRDFNRTEWLDLSMDTDDKMMSESLNLGLIRESYMLNYAFREYSRRVALQEAIILSSDSNDKFDKIIAMQEAEYTQLSSTVRKIFTVIRSVLEKALGAILDKIGMNARYIKKWENYINKPYRAGTATSTGDIMAGYQRVQDKIDMISMENIKQTLTSGDNQDSQNGPKEFFKKYLLPKLNAYTSDSKSNLKWNDDMSIASYCKAYYGYGGDADGEKGNKYEYSTDEINRHKQGIIKFLTSSNRLAATARSDTRNLEVTVDSFMKSNGLGTNATSSDAQAAMNAAKNTTANTANNNNTAAKQEATMGTRSYYSELYGMVLTELDVIKGPEQKEAEGNTNANTQQQTAQNKQTIAKDNSPTEALNKACTNYLKCYQDVFAARLSAMEFLQKELSTLIRAHAESYMTAEEKAAAKAEQQQNADNANQTQQQQNGGVVRNAVNNVVNRVRK